MFSYTPHKSRMVPLISLTCIVTSELNKVHLFLEYHATLPGTFVYKLMIS